jgi:antirestriction protein ArdC
MKLSFVSPLIEGHSAVQPVSSILPLATSVSQLKALLHDHNQEGEFDRAYYVDSENDHIALSDDEDFQEAQRYLR